MSASVAHIPTFVFCTDKKYYEDLVYQDVATRREWFVVFDAKEPAEIVIREAALKKGLTPYAVLINRGFDECLGLTRAGVGGILDGRKDPHKRFFGPEADGKPLDGHTAVSWFLRFRKGVALPAPNANDSCIEIWPLFPPHDGVFFGLR